MIYHKAYKDLKAVYAINYTARNENDPTFNGILDLEMDLDLVLRSLKHGSLYPLRHRLQRHTADAISMANLPYNILSFTAFQYKLLYIKG